MLKHALFAAAAAFLGGATLAAAPASAQVLVTSGYVSGPVYVTTTGETIVSGYKLVQGAFGKPFLVAGSIQAAPVLATPVVTTPTIRREIIVTRPAKHRGQPVHLVPVTDVLYGF